MDEPYSVSAEPNRQEDREHWYPALLVGALFGTVSFLFGLLVGYQQIASEPTGELMSGYMIAGVLIGFATMFAGMATVWYYTRKVRPEITLGRGAFVGLLTGLVVVFSSSILNEIWKQVDPVYEEALVESIVADVEQMVVPSDVRQQLTDQLSESFREQTLVSQIVAGSFITGLLNLLTGLIGAKVFGARVETDGGGE